MKILVTGVAGAIGSHVAERFASLGHEVIGVDSLSDFYPRAIKEMNLADVRARGVTVHIKDLASDDIADILSNADMIYHFAAQPGISATTPFGAYLKDNIVATHQLLEAARRLPHLRVFVHISTSSVYGKHAAGDETTEPKPTSYYGVTKLAGEQLALSYHRELGVPVTVLRLFSVYGERERPEKLYHRLTQSILAGKPFPLHEGSREHRRSYTYVGDVVDACARLPGKLDNAIGEIFNIGNDASVTTGRGIEIIEELLGEKAQFTTFPRRPGDQAETAACITKARNVLGYVPRVSLEEGLRRQVLWHKEKFLRTA